MVIVGLVQVNSFDEGVLVLEVEGVMASLVLMPELTVTTLCDEPHTHSPTALVKQKIING